MILTGFHLFRMREGRNERSGIVIATVTEDERRIAVGERRTLWFLFKSCAISFICQFVTILLPRFVFGVEDTRELSSPPEKVESQRVRIMTVEIRTPRAKNNRAYSPSPSVCRSIVQLACCVVEDTLGEWVAPSALTQDRELERRSKSRRNATGKAFSVRTVIVSIFKASARSAQVLNVLLTSTVSRAACRSAGSSIGSV
jgi:hypothetical protein